MQFLDLTLATPEQNLALDKALLITAEANGDLEFLRVWESPSYVVVLGKNCREGDDVCTEQCLADSVPVLRRSSGGGTVLVGPGCLNFALVLRYDRAPRLAAVDISIAYVLERIREAVSRSEPRVELAGTSDLAVAGRKFCGNAQRRLRTHFLHHGTILYDFDLAAIPRYLREPRRQPAYRAGRDHASFLTNVRADPTQLRQALAHVWRADAATASWPADLVERLIKEQPVR